MFVTVSTYRAKAGEEDAVIALHEDWQRHQQSRAKGYLSGELLRNVEADREFIAIMRFESGRLRWRSQTTRSGMPGISAW